MPFDIIQQFLAKNALKFVGQDVLDDLVDKLLAEVCQGLESLGLDPLPIPDINIPFSLDKVTEAVVPLTGAEDSPIRQLLQTLLPLCASCTKKFTGQLKLKDGNLEGLAKLVRQNPVTLDWQENGSVRLATKFGVENLKTPFQSEANLETMTVNPIIAARVSTVSLDLDVQIPVTGGEVESDFQMETGDVLVDLDGLGPLDTLAEYISPYVAEKVGAKVKEVLRTQVKETFLKEVERKLPGISALVS